jgi:hypothetical protein
VLYNVLLGKPKGKRPPGRPKYIWENNIKMDLVLIPPTAPYLPSLLSLLYSLDTGSVIKIKTLTKIGWEDLEWINLALDTDQLWARVNTVMKLGFSKMLRISLMAEQLLPSKYSAP